MKFLLFPLMIISMFSCKTKKSLTKCNQKVISSMEEYQNAPKDDVEIQDVNIDNDCLEIEFSAGGCDGNSWKVNLINSEISTRSIPPQLSIRLSLENKEICEAFITKKASFDISSLRMGGNEVILIIDGYAKYVSYKY